MSMRRARGLLAAAVVVLGAAWAPAPPEDPAAQQKLLAEVALPPLGLADADETKQPPLDLRGTSLQAYPDRGNAKSAFREAVREAQVLLWATTRAAPPAALKARVDRMRRELKVPAAPPKAPPKGRKGPAGPPSDLLKGRYDIPNAKEPRQLQAQEKRLKALVVDHAHHLARMAAALEEMLEALDKVKDDGDKETPRWQANYTLMRGCVMLRLCALEDHAVSLGQMRKEAPPHGKNDRAWQLRTADEVRDPAARKRLKQARKLLDGLVAERSGTVWERAADRALRMQLGTEWMAVR
jgi:hypothetical protein